MEKNSDVFLLCEILPSKSIQVIVSLCVHIYHSLHIHSLKLFSANRAAYWKWLNTNSVDPFGNNSDSDLWKISTRNILTDLMMEKRTACGSMLQNRAVKAGFGLHLFRSSIWMSWSSSHISNQQWCQQKWWNVGGRYGLDWALRDVQHHQPIDASLFNHLTNYSIKHFCTLDVK